MSAFSFRPQVEQLDGRCLPSANPTISISDVALAEGNSGQTRFVFTVSLSKASSREVSVNFATADAYWAAAGEDFIGQTGRLTFAPGETAKTITILVNGDDWYEGSESFFVNLSHARHASIADAQAYGTILEDDPQLDGGYSGDGGYSFNGSYGP